MHMRVAAVTVFFAVVFATPAFAWTWKTPGAPVNNNTITQWQSNTSNGSIVSQPGGTDNSATSVQSGFFNFSYIGQSGSNNTAFTFQSGTGSVSVTNQVSY